MAKKIYAFAGRKRSGKGVLCNVLVKHYNVKIITIADYLKLLCCKLIDCDYDSLNRMKDDGTVFNKIVNQNWIDIINKETDIDCETIKNELSKVVFTNVRQMLQVIGTDLIRKYKPDWHINKMIDDINSYDNNTIIAIDDVRFMNEREAIESLGGRCYFIMRPKYMNVSNHISERSLFWHDFYYDDVLINDKDVKYFEDSFLEYIQSDFDMSSNKLSLINHYEYLTPVMNLGKVYDNYTKIILNKVIDRYDFNNEGKFSIKLPFDKTFNSTYDIKPDLKGFYNIDNPCVIENFKQWI